MILISFCTDKCILQKKENITMKFQNEFTKKTKFIENYVKDYIHPIMDKDDIQKALFLNEQLSFFVNGFAIAIYDKNKLSYLSDNSITLPEDYNASFFNSKIKKLPNAYVYSHRSIYNGKVIIGLMLIKWNFKYENEYLKNKFHVDFKLPSNVNININQPTKNIIKDNDSNAAFALDFSSYRPIYVTKLYLLAILFIIALIITIGVLHVILKELISIPALRAILFFGAILALRVAMISKNIPSIFYELELFSSTLFFSNDLAPSLGDLILNVFLLFLLLIFENKILSSNVKQRILSDIIIILKIALASIFLLFFTYNIKNLVFNSNINLDLSNLKEITGYTIFVYFLLVFMLSVFITIIVKSIDRSSSVSYSYFAGCFSPLFMGHTWMEIIVVISSAAIVALIMYVRDQKFQVIKNLIFTLIISLLTTYCINRFIIDKEKNVRTSMMVNITIDQDPELELLFTQRNDAILDDKKVVDILSNNEKPYNYIYYKYFNRLMGKYDLVLTTATSEDVLTLKNNSVELTYDYFEEIIRKYGTKIENTNFYYIDNNNGRINYLGWLKYRINDKEVSIFAEIESRLISLGIGFPELLLMNKSPAHKRKRDLSYASYHKGKLVYHSGKYTYGLHLPEVNNTSDYFFYKEESYDHLFYKIDENNHIILSKEESSIGSFLAMFSYIFLLFYIIYLLYDVINKLLKKEVDKVFNFKRKIQYTFTISIVTLTIIIAWWVIYYNTNQYHQSFRENIYEKISATLLELNLKYNEFQINNTKFTENESTELNRLLIRLSNIFYADINIFSNEGLLISSSRNAVFQNGLISKKMNTRALLELSINGKTEYSQNERIGELNFLSVYKPIVSNNNEILGYINLPCFINEIQVSNRVSQLVVSVVNISIIIIFISIVIGLLLAKGIVSPLEEIQKSFKDINLTGHNEIISYTSKDELGELVNAYNLMVKELGKSAKLLAKSEREGAWRKMAKQIAHEIKNPLTPMKLNIQYLQRAFNEKLDNRDEKFQKISKLLIEQIETLSSTASLFSDFAGATKTVLQRFDLKPLLQNSIDLYRSTDVVYFITNLDEFSELIIYADAKEIRRVFINLLKNAIQAIPETVKGVIEVMINVDADYVVVEIKDNGKGIPDEICEKLFEPNFTTKSSGMGLGLAIVKTIVENCNGEIWFDTIVDEGTSFYIKFPIIR